MIDLHVEKQGSIYLLTPISETGQEWIDEHIPRDATMWGVNSVVVEHRYIEDIVEGARLDGLEVMT
jgi:hypothetical protein